MNDPKIVLIDADAPSRNYLVASLHQQGYEVLPAASGKEGLVAAWTDNPRLIIVDPVLPDLTGEELAARLRAHALTAETPLVALSSDAQAVRRQSCLQAGFSSFLVKSPAAMPALIETLAGLMQTGKARVPREGGQLIVFLSAKGGTGTSTLCANLAMNMAEQQPGARLVVADLVLPIGSIAEIVGYAGPQNLVSIGKMPTSETTVEFLGANLPSVPTWGFHLLAGSPDPELGNQLNVARIGDIIIGLQQAYDYVVLDLGRSLSRISLPLIERADLIAMITGTDMSTVTLTRAVWEYLQHKGVNGAAVFVILNRAVGLEGLTKAEAEKLIGLPIRAAMPYLGGNASLANNQHAPYCVKYPGDTASIIFKETALQMRELATALRTG